MPPEVGGLMKKIFVLIAITLEAAVSQASEIKCAVQEYSEKETIQQEYILVDSEDPHGSFHTFQMKQYADYSGFVALSQGVIVIHLYGSDIGHAISAQSYGKTDRYARLQYIMGKSGLSDAIVIECIETPADAN